MTGVVQSYGAGVQSRALLHMAIDGRFPRPDRVIFADTQAEPQAVYQTAHEDQATCQREGIPFDTVTTGDLSQTPATGSIFIPAFTRNGTNGMLRRQCTDRYKITPIRRHLRALGYERVTLWLGITTDESIRMKPSHLKWITNHYPLIERGISRDDCDTYLARKGLAGTKSACVFCPYRSRYGWARVRANPTDWRAAIEYDERLREARPEAGLLYVHPDRVPLREADVPDLASMTSLFDADLFGNECEGHCGV
jgi:hypothetical protein